MSLGTAYTSADHCLCFMCVHTGQVGVVERCGKWSHNVRDGCHFLNCFCCECYADVTCETKTKENTFITVTVSIQYEVCPDKVYDYFYRLSDPFSQMKAYVFDVVRSSVPHIKLDDVFTTKEEISQKIKDELSEALGVFGIKIVATPITDIDPASEVKRAMNKINVEQRLRIAAESEAESAKFKQVKAAEAMAEETMIQAKADAEAKYQQGLGISRQRQAIMNGLRESVITFSDSVDDVNSKTVMDMMMLTQYFDTLREIGTSGGNNTVFTEHSPGHVGELGRQIQNSFMQAMTTQAPNPMDMKR